MVHIFFITFTQFFLLYLVKCEEFGVLPFYMSNVHPNVSDTALCISMDVGQSNTYYITGFRSNASNKSVHHLAVDACISPVSFEPIWECGAPSETVINFTIPESPMCRPMCEVIYAWMGSEPKLILPDDGAFKVGKDSALKYLVLQVHYLHPFKDGSTDSTGVDIFYSKTPRTKNVGWFTATADNGFIQPHSLEHVEISCVMQENKTIYPVAYQIHTHDLGKLVSGYVIKNGSWFEIGDELWRFSLMLLLLKFGAYLYHGCE
ncbi:hypothetical protein QAD02_018311 [Eretmocerus hayati]|uniref:Uncharacterized protein n=1 Tax=Eretmocerus hayati TaxID=131215 RepID=A0ACC2PIU4_9HYME|nr:hypothetical protein QAD02_018311 [Eretmocerus hayati]